MLVNLGEQTLEYGKPYQVKQPAPHNKYKTFLIPSALVLLQLHGLYFLLFYTNQNIYEQDLKLVPYQNYQQAL